MENTYAVHKDGLEACLVMLEKHDVTPFMLYAYAEAKAMERSRVDTLESSLDETEQEKAAYTVWDEFDGQVDSAMDEARDFVEQEYEEIGAAMVAIYGERA